MDDVRCVHCGAPADVSKNFGAPILIVSTEGPVPVMPGEKTYECDRCGKPFLERDFRRVRDSGELPPPV